MHKECFTQISNSIIDMQELTHTEFRLCIWLLKHQAHFVPSMRYITQRTGLKYETIKNIMPTVLQKLSQYDYPDAQKIITKIKSICFKIAVKNTPKVEQKHSNNGDSTAPITEVKRSNWGYKKDALLEHNNTNNNINKKTSGFLKKMFFKNKNSQPLGVGQLDKNIKPLGISKLEQEFVELMKLG